MNMLGPIMLFFSGRFFSEVKNAPDGNKVNVLDSKVCPL